jgi:hypothetical protein
MSESFDAETIARRVRGLLSKTVENGCSEQEAMTAATMARRLMDQYRLSQTDVEIEAEPIADELIDRPTPQGAAAVDHCLWGIDAYCGVKTWFSSSYGTGKRIRKIRMLGLKPDVEMGAYLYKMLASAIETETNRYMAEVKAAIRSGERPWLDSTGTRRESSTFQVQMAYRINQRLKDMAKALEPTAMTATGTALVVVKDHAVSAAFGKLGIKLTGGSSGMSSWSGSNRSAADAGRAAGDRVNLSHPVTGGATRRIA